MDGGSAPGGWGCVGMRTMSMPEPAMATIKGVPAGVSVRARVAKAWAAGTQGLVMAAAVATRLKMQLTVRPRI
jgi:hypothetical protein